MVNIFLKGPLYRVVSSTWTCFCFLIFCLFVFLPHSLPARNIQGVETLPPEKIKEGMTGYGKTVFEGHRIDTFSVEVKGKLQNMLPDQDIILIEASHPILETTNIMSGMSGSPIYINGKLIGALAYSWSFEKKPLAGVTPIKKIFKANRRNRPAGSSENINRLESSLAVSGIQGRYRELLEEKLSDYGVEVQTVTAGNDSGKYRKTSLPDNPLKPGDAFGAQLMNGDLSMTAIGTVTHVDDKQVYGFGHPFMNAGQIELPMTTAEVQTQMASLQSSFKLSSAGDRIGTINQDRQAAILGQTGNIPDMLPVKMNLKTQDDTFQENYQVNVIKNKYLTPNLINLAASNFASSKMNQLGMNRLETDISLELSSDRSINLRNTSIVSGSFDPWAFLPLSSLWKNPFRQIAVEEVTIDITLTKQLEAARIDDVWLASDALRPGEQSKIYIKIDPYRGKPVVKETTLRIPDTLHGNKAKLHVAPGSAVKSLQAEPETFEQMIDYLNAPGVDNELAVVLQLPQLSLNSSGHQMDELPYSISGLFKRSAGTSSDFQAESSAERIKTDWVLSNKESIVVPIKN